MPNVFWTIGGFSSAASLAIGAYGAHALRCSPADIHNYDRATLLQLIHSMALMFSTTSESHNKLSAYLFTSGTAIFCGSVYLRSLGAPVVGTPGRYPFGWLEAMTPLGGVTLIAGWIALALQGQASSAKNR